MAVLDEECCWQAVLRRETLAVPFVYAVRSTGIYCRPTCPSRRPQRQQVLFFAQPAAAEQAGFRACLRCHPQDDAPPAPQLALVQRICRFIDERHDSPPDLAELGAAFGLSPAHMQRTFKRVLGITPRQYAEARRLDAFKARLRAGQSVSDALYEAGYGSSSRLYERAPAQMGMTPTAYQQGGAGMQIRYSIVDSALGRLLVAATTRGLCMVSLGDSDSDLEAALWREYPAAAIACDDGALHAWLHDLLRHLAGQQPHLDLPLDVQATAFQWQVWQALRAIPYGETRTYSELARQHFDNANAARAVARACATNPVSIVVPCHRVVREDGSLGGYRWGLERKRKLLQQEQG